MVQLLICPTFFSGPPLLWSSVWTNLSFVCQCYLLHFLLFPLFTSPPLHLSLFSIQLTACFFIRNLCVPALQLTGPIGRASVLGDTTTFNRPIVSQIHLFAKERTNLFSPSACYLLYFTFTFSGQVDTYTFAAHLSLLIYTKGVGAFNKRKSYTICLWNTWICSGISSAQKG